MFSGGREKVHWEQIGEDRSRFSPAQYFSSFRIPNMHIFFFREKCLVSELLSIFYGSHFKTAKTKTSVSIIMFPINCQMFIVLYNIFRGKRNGNDVVLVSLLVILNMFHMFYYFCCWSWAVSEMFTGIPLKKLGFWMKKELTADIQTHFLEFKQRKVYQPFKRQPNKMAKHTQAICRLLPTNCLNVFDHFVGLVLKGLNTSAFQRLFLQKAPS